MAVPGQTAWVGDRLLSSATFTDGSGRVSVNSFVLFSASLEGVNAAFFYFLFFFLSLSISNLYRLPSR